MDGGLLSRKYAAQVFIYTHKVTEMSAQVGHDKNWALNLPSFWKGQWQFYKETSNDTKIVTWDYSLILSLSFL